MSLILENVSFIRKKNLPSKYLKRSTYKSDFMPNCIYHREIYLNYGVLLGYYI